VTRCPLAALVGSEPRRPGRVNPDDREGGVKEGEAEVNAVIGIGVRRDPASRPNGIGRDRHRIPMEWHDEAWTS
jgi:hypothetical protein